MEIAPEVKEAYEKIRLPQSDLKWVTFKYDDSKVVVDTSGTDHGAFLDMLPDDAPLYAYYRVEVKASDATRTKFVFVSWVGENVSPLTKGKVSVDKPQIKSIIKDFSIEIATSDQGDLTYDKILDTIGSADH
ncbi:coactosin family protein [Streptomyces sp. RPT161]|uniref:coactosin family protein n=1 Tax=Streptomyces sp. RPT161 TaxID=3015993 RepID=UPI0022B8CD42|nr:coactosin family protein [Streptomyces sp. RPT161]